MLSLKNISKTYYPGTDREKKVLKNLNLDVNTGDFVTIIGTNGAGKSTLFQILAGNEKPDCGTVTLNGTDITNLPAHERASFLSLLYQDPMRATAPLLTIEENMALAGLRSRRRLNPFHRITKEEKETYRSFLSALHLGLEDRMDVPAGQLSGGQRQALSLLTAVLSRPEILLLDEHTAALDPKTAEEIIRLTNQFISTQHITCLMITHNLTQALQLGNRLWMLGRGHLIADLNEAEKQQMTVEDLMRLFQKEAAEAFLFDRS